MVTTFYPDVNEYTGRISVAGAPLLQIRATIGLKTDALYSYFKGACEAARIPYYVYHFLNSESVTGEPGEPASPERQAEYAFSAVGKTPLMVDHERNRGAVASIGEACRFVDEYRKLGGIVHPWYYPHWEWEAMAYPSMRPIQDRDMLLFSSNYTEYSDTGPGWQSYDGIFPVTNWQYTNAQWFNGVAVDFNAVKMTPALFMALIGGDVLSPEDIAAVAKAVWEQPVGHDGRPAHFYLSDAGDMANFGYSQYDGRVGALALAKSLAAVAQSLAQLGTAGGLTDADRQLVRDLTDAVTALNNRLASP